MPQDQTLSESALLIRTKFNMPRLGAELIERPHLIARLERSIDRKMTLVVAPAGYGKSTLIATWLQQQQRPVAWLSLDESDSDLQVFLRYVIEAIRTVFPQACPDTETLLNIGHMPSTDRVDVLARTLINDLSDLSASTSTSSFSTNAAFALVLDDYHLISESAIHRLVNKLIAYQPSQLHLIIISRRDPVALPLVRLRAQREMLEIRMEALAFDLDETRAFLTQVSRLDIEDEAVAVLAQKTEGWAVGLQLASLSLRRLDDPTHILQMLSNCPEIT